MKKYLCILSVLSILLSPMTVSASTIEDNKSNEIQISELDYFKSCIVS